MRVLLLLLVTIALAVEPYEAIPGRWYPDTYRGAAAGSDSHRAEVEALASIGYLDGYEHPTGRSGVVVWDRQRSVPGLSLYSSGHAAEALLINPDGSVRHRWAMPFSEALPGANSRDPKSTGAWRRVALRPRDGHLLGVYDGEGLVHLDAKSRVVWATANRAHHEARWRPDGRVLVLTRVLHEGAGPANKPLYEDFVAELDPGGGELRRVSVLAALRASPWSKLLSRSPPDTGDVLHTNALYPLDELPDDGSGLMGPGKVLLSMRHIGALMVLDLDHRKVLWASVGGWQKQHDAEITPSGRMMLFDNRGGVGGTSRVLQLDPWTNQIRWSYAGTPQAPLLSEVLGAAQELPGGNILITESTRGRVIEVTRGGEVVWEFRNPERAGPNREFIAAIFEMVRFPPTIRW